MASGDNDVRMKPALPYELRVRSPEGLVFVGPVVAVCLPVPDGYVGVLARHAPMLAALRCGVLKVSHADGTTEIMAMGEGFAQVSRDTMRLAVHFFDYPDGVDRDRAHRAMERALHRLRRTVEDEGWDVVRADAALCRAISRLSACGCGCRACASVKWIGSM